jgi:hypothetical protein
MRTPLLALAPVLLVACPADPVESGDTGEATAVDLWGTVTDPYLHGAPVDGAWVLLDLGDEQVALRTGADGSFALPGLPGERPVTITVAGEGAMAVSYAGVRLAEATMPLELSTHQRDIGSYATERMTISGTVSGAPVGSYVFFFGATDAATDTSYLDYVQVSSEDPVPFEVAPELILPGADYTLGALAFDGSDWIVQASSAGTVTWGGSEALDLVLDPEALQDLAVSAAAPSLDGEPVSILPDDLCHSLAVTHLGESMSATTGYNRACEAQGDGFALDVGWAPVEGFTDRLQLYLLEDLGTGSYAFGSLRIPEGATTMDVTLLDSPILEHHDELMQGDGVGWQGVEGASSYMLYGYDEQGSLAWYLYPAAGALSFTVPSFPEDFDPAVILEQGSWAVVGRHLVYGDDGLLDQSEDYTGSITHGGQLFL